MAIRNIHALQPLAQRSKTLREAGSVSAFREFPRWKKYMMFGRIAEELGKDGPAGAWRRRAFTCALEHGEYITAEVLASAYLSEEESKAANSLALLRENLSSGRTNIDLRSLISDALLARAPLELVKFELSRPNVPASMSFCAWKNTLTLPEPGATFKKSA